MVKCPKCGYEAETDTCLVCGQKIDLKTSDESSQNDVDFQRPNTNTQEETNTENIEEITQSETTESKPVSEESPQEDVTVDEVVKQEYNQPPQQQYNQPPQQQYNQVPQQQQYNNPAPTNQQVQNPYNNYTNYQQNPSQRPQNQKSKIIGLILNMIIVGGGYAYVGKWGEGLVMLIIYVIMFFLGFLLLFPFIIALILWIYTLFKTNDMIDKYNAGLPY